MIRRILSVVLLSAAMVAARPTTNPSPSTRPSPLSTTKPATQKAQIKLPTPAEIIAQRKQEEDKKKALLQVAYIDFDRGVVEKPSDFALFGDTAMTLQSVLTRLQKAHDDANVKAVLLTLGSTHFNLSQASEIRDTLLELKSAGKRVFVYADGYDTDEYVMATGASDICMLEGGEIEIPGVGLETMFAKGLLDKVGVKADYVQIGEYKGADEEYTRTEPSKELRGELNKLVNGLYSQIVYGIAHNRKLDAEKVEELIDQSLVTGKAAKKAGLVDHLIDIDGMRDLITKQMGKEIDVVHDYGLAPKEQLDFSNPFALLKLLTQKPQQSDKTAVAVVYAQGVIVDGGGEGSLFSEEQNIGSEDMRRTMRMAARDDSIKAIVLRIDSPGGSALASEVMWQAVRRVAKDKPVIISIGSMAASGGYYLASAGDRIFADPTAIVGSIGVVGGKFVFKDLFEKLGLNTETFSRGKNANLFSSNEPWTDVQKQMVTKWMRETYEQFTERVMSSRKGKIQNIDEVAKGRIFVAKDALKLGMVDQIGGLQEAIKYAAGAANLQSGEFEIRVLPPTRTLADLFHGGDGAEEKLPIRPSIHIDELSILKTLSPSTAHLLKQQIQMLQLLQKRPFMLVSPYVITTH